MKTPSRYIILPLILATLAVWVGRDALAAGGRPLLLLADVDSAGTHALESALEAAGYDVTRVTPEYTWTGSNPAASGFDCVVHLNGRTPSQPLSVNAQKALVEFVRNGGGFIASQWNGFERVQGQQVDMNDLVLQLWPHPDNCVRCSMTWSVVPGQEGHPVLAGVPSSFTFFADGHDAGPQVVFSESPSTVLMRSPGDGPAVTVREFEKGRIVSLSSAANSGNTDLTLQDFNVLTVYVNAAQWACNAPPPPPVCNAPATITPPDAPVYYTATTATPGASVEITDYGCYFINGAGKKKTGSCNVSADGDTITIHNSGGVGNHIVWTARASDGNGNESEPVSCEIEVVNPGKKK